MESLGKVCWNWAGLLSWLCLLSIFASPLCTCSVFVWSQYDGANIEQRTKGYGWRQNQKGKLVIVGGVILLEVFLDDDIIISQYKVCTLSTQTENII